MSNNTVEQFAAELRRPVADLLKQLQEAGVSKTSGSDSITSDDKKLLLAYLKKSHGSESGTISIGRKKAEVSTVAGVQVETRRRARTVVVPSKEGSPCQGSWLSLGTERHAGRLAVPCCPFRPSQAGCRVRHG